MFLLKNCKRDRKVLIISNNLKKNPHLQTYLNWCPQPFKVVVDIKVTKMLITINFVKTVNFRSYNEEKNIEAMILLKIVERIEVTRNVAVLLENMGNKASLFRTEQRVRRRKRFRISL